MNRGVLRTKKVRTLILDETDEMLNFGFQEDIEKVLKFIRKEQEETDYNV